MRFIHNKTSCHFIMKALFSCSKSNHEISYTENKPGKELSGKRPGCFSERYTLPNKSVTIIPRAILPGELLVYQNFP